MARQHHTYTDLVNDGSDDDIVGRIAYTLYKNEKLSWIKSFQEANGQAPTEDEIFKNFHHTVEGKYEWYREEATRLMNDYIDINLEERLGTYQKELRDHAIVKAVSKGWLRSIAENVLAGFVAAIIVVGFNTMYWLYKQAPEGAAAKAAAQALAPPSSSDAPASASR